MCVPTSHAVDCKSSTCLSGGNTLLINWSEYFRGLKKKKKKASVIATYWIYQCLSVKTKYKYTPWGTDVPDTQIQSCPECRPWISSVGRWDQGSGSGLPSSGWCAWCCCHCGPSWRGDAGVRCPGGWSQRWCSPGSQLNALATELFPSGSKKEKTNWIIFKNTNFIWNKTVSLKKHYYRHRNNKYINERCQNKY